MIPVYNAYFGFSEAPFNITPDPSFLYQSESHREGLAQLLYGINARRGFIVLTGEVGTGKTTLIQALLRQLDANTQTALIFSAITNPVDLLRYVCEEFALVEPMRAALEAHDYISLLNEFLLRGYRAGENAALIIDEAQNLSADVLESIRLLSNFETPKDKLLQILLVGQPELTDRLNTPQLRQLRQRVTLRHRLRPLSLAECREYIAIRLKQAGGSSTIFSPGAIDEIHQFSGGIPRLINVICDNAMINAYALDHREVDPLIIQEVAEDLCLTGGRSRSPVPRREKPVRPEPQPKVRTEPIKTPPPPLVNGNSNGAGIESNAGVSAHAVLPPSFLSSLREALIDAMGPMGQIILAEQVKLLGGSMERFPREKVTSLIDSVSREIFDASIRERFRQSMSNDFRRLQKN